MPHVFHYIAREGVVVHNIDRSINHMICDQFHQLSETTVIMLI